MLSLRLNPDLDTERLAREYAEHQCVQIPGFLEEASAAQLEATRPSLPWRLILQDDTHTNLYLTADRKFKPTLRCSLLRGTGLMVSPRLPPPCQARQTRPPETACRPQLPLSHGRNPPSPTLT
ncbi:MAG: hypothetical protein IT480_04990 [Gammaproteobacteria bacterium]|nr:hypothetical protein [Gammaproteobacteria bacterium]